MDSQAWAQLRLERMHVAPRVLDLAPPEVQRQFVHLWATLDELSVRLKELPTGLVRFWLQQPTGHVVITHLASHYEPGEYRLKHHVLSNVAFVGISDLAQGSLEALVPIGHWLDHLLGNAGAEEGPWLSQGGGASVALQEVGAHVTELFALGHGFDAQACRDARTYFARSLALYWHDRRALNAADPLLERLLRTTLCADAFWRSLH
jgi:hypothetical protein